MKILDMFEKPIRREIKGVIKVGQKDDENVFQELDEYVVTTELEKYMNRFFDAYNRSMTGSTDNMGVWISGFFGSGKSHFLKILSYILSNKEVENSEGIKKDAASFFTQGVKVEDRKLKDKIADILDCTTKDNIELAKVLCAGKDFPKDMIADILINTTKENIELAKILSSTLG